MGYHQTKPTRLSYNPNISLHCFKQSLIFEVQLYFVDLFNKYSQFYPLVVHFDTNRCVVKIKNTDCYLLCINPVQIIVLINNKSKDCNMLQTSSGESTACTNYSSKGSSIPWCNISDNFSSKQNYSFMSCTPLHDTFYLEALQIVSPNEWDTRPHLVVISDTYLAGTNKTTADDSYPWLNKDNQRYNIIGRETIEWKVNLRPDIDKRLS